MREKVENYFAGINHLLAGVTALEAVCKEVQCL